MDIPEVVEVRFKNTRKGYYRNVNELRLKRGDIIAVEASPGHDIGIISLAGEIVEKQRPKTKYNGNTEDLKKVYRKGRTDHASEPEDRHRPGIKYENRGCGIPGRQHQSHFLLHS